MARLVKYASTLDRAGLANVTRGWRALNGQAIEFGAMSATGGPPPEHTGHDGKPKGVTTNDVLRFIEFGTLTSRCAGGSRSHTPNPFRANGSSCR